MTILEDKLALYAEYHRDTRNVATHFLGIPMIVVAVTVLLSRPMIDVGGYTGSPAIVAAMLAGVYYLRLDLKLGLLMCGLLALCVGFGAWSAGRSTVAWLAIGIGLFVVGWIFQLIGHAWEGRKPAFVDDLIGLIIGPLFVTVECLFLFGWLQELRHTIEARAGQSRKGRTREDAARA